MRILTIFAVLLGLFIRPAIAQSQYDTRWIPISSAEIQRQVRLNANDEVELYQLWWRSIYQLQKASYFKALHDLKKRQPSNAVVLANYCSVLLESRENFGRPPLAVAGKDFSLDKIRIMLNRAKELRPRLWSIYTAEAALALFEGADSDKKRYKAAQKAYKLAPLVSFTNKTLGYAHSNLALKNRGGPHTNEAIFYYKRAQKLNPANAGAGFLLLNIYRYSKPNAVEAKKAERAILATIPPNVKLNAKCLDILKRYNIPYKPKT